MKVHQGIFPVGQASSKHSHLDSEEICFIIKGQGEVTIGEKTIKYGANSLVFIPPGIPHQYRNTEKEEMMLLAIYSPPTELPKK
jgi:quercetin dioxygenase-like cupin family protein